MFCNFSSVIKILLEHKRENMPDFEDKKHDYTQLSLIRGLFDSYYQENADFEFDNGVVNKWIQGARPVYSGIVNYYRVKENHEKMTDCFEDFVLPYLFDFDKVIEKLYLLLTNDREHLSSKIRRKLTKNYPFEDERDKCKFVTDLICTTLDGTGVIGKNLLTANEIAIVPAVYGADVPPVCRYFCGRDKELEELHKILETEKNIFISGFAGIGKSEFAKAFAAKYKKEFRNIFYFTYNGSLENMIADIDHSDDIVGEDKQTRFKNHNSFMNSLNDDTLIIIDNFNVTATDDPFLDKMLNYHCKIIFTTRSNFDDEFTYTLDVISDTETLTELFSRYYSHTEENIETVKEIIGAVHKHTLSVEMSAKLLEKGIHSPTEVLECLKKNSAEPRAADKIKVRKDGANIKETYYNHIRALFSLCSLTDKQKQIMMCMVIVPADGIRKKQLAEYMKLDDMNDINDLAELGFIATGTLDIVVLHPMIRDIAILDLKPSINGCKVFVNSINEKMLIQGIELPNSAAIISIVENTIKYPEKDNTALYLDMLENACGFADNYPFPERAEFIGNLLSEMQKYITENKDKALYLNYMAMLKRETENDLQTALEYLQNALSLCEKDKNIVLYANLNMNIAIVYFEMNRVNESLELMRKAIDMLVGSEIYNNDLIVMVLNYTTVLFDTGHYQESLNIMIECKHITEGAKTVFHARLIYNIAAVYAIGKYHDKAIRHFERAFNEFTELGCTEECNYRKLLASELLKSKGIEYPQNRKKDHLA